MPLQWTTTDQSVNNGVKCLVYGDSGAGKTVLCRTAPAPIIISAESGLLSLRGVRIPVIQIKTVQDLEEAYRWCFSAAEAKQFQTVCVDSISEIAEVVLANAKPQVKDPRQAYGAMQEQMIALIRAFRDLPARHVYVAAKQALLKDEMTGLVTYGPSMPGTKVGPQMPYYFDEVFHLGVGRTQQGESYRYLLTQKDMQHVAKDRSGALAPVETPDLNAVFTKIMEQTK